MQQKPALAADRPARFLGFLDALVANPRRERWLLCALMVLAALLRVLYVLDLRANPTFSQPLLDSEYHVEWARAMARGEDYYALKHGAPGPYFRAPLYIWLLSLCLQTVGDNLLWPRLLQALLGAAGVGLTYLVGKLAFGARAAVLAAFGVATYWVLIYFDGELLIETLIVPLDLLALWLTMRCAGPARPRAAALAGLAWGLSAIARPNVVLFAPCVALWLLWQARPHYQRALRVAAVFSLAFLVPILPITARNYFHGGDLVLIASQGGVNFWIGNNPQSDGSTAIVPGTRGGWWSGYFDAIAQAEQAAGRKLKPSEVSQYFAAKAWDFILKEPARSLPLLLHKLRLFWIDHELGNNEDVRFVAHHYSWIPRWMPLRFAWVGPLGILGLGLVLIARERQRHFPLWAFLCVYMVSVVAFFVCSRFRAPVLPVLILFAAQAVLWLGERVLARDWPRLIRALALLLPATLLVNWLPANLRRDDSNGYMQLGVAEWNRGNKPQAIAHLEEAIAIKANNSFAQTYLGMFLHDQKRSDEAITHLQQALLSDARNVDAAEALLGVYFDLGRFAELEQTLKDVQNLHPQSEIPYYHYGRLRAEQARRLQPQDSRAALEAMQKASLAFRDALARAPGSFRAAFALANALCALGQYQEAMPHLEAALQRVEEAGAFEVALYQLSLQTLQRLGRKQEACQLAQDWQRRRPTESEAARAVAQHCP